MYEAYWNLTKKPFENTPDPTFLYLSEEHEEALSRLFYAVTEGKGCAMLTGVFGCGKTLIAQTLLEKLEPDIYRVGVINNPVMSSVELLRAIATHLGASDLPTRKTELLKDVLIDTIGELLMNNLNDGRKSVVIIDEMHAITDKHIFEELRLLLNFQLKDRFLLTLLFLGQPELNRLIDMNKQLNQRIAIRYHLEALSQEEIIEYVSHRLSVAGSEIPIFSDEGLQGVFKKSGGIPRRINQICDMSLLIGMERELEAVSEDVVSEASKSLEGQVK